MQTIGLIAGMSWESSQLYYQMINRDVQQRLGGLHSAQMLIYSVDFAPIEQLQHAGDWDGAAAILIDEAWVDKRVDQDVTIVKAIADGALQFAALNQAEIRVRHDFGACAQAGTFWTRWAFHSGRASIITCASAQG